MKPGEEIGIRIEQTLTSPITLSRLTNGVPYLCFVSAANDIGTGLASVLSAPFTPEVDTDGDGVNDLIDNCVSISNPGQQPSTLNANCAEACVTSGCAGRAGGRY
jgi:hypothetical protein